MNYIEASKKVFNAPRPKSFMDNPSHCEECEEVEKNAQESDIDTLTLEKAGDGYASFACFLNDNGFKYYMPAFIRLSIETDMDDGYIENFFFAITVDKKDNSRLKSFTSEQKAFVHNFLVWYKENKQDILEQWLIEENEINEAISLWHA